MVGRLPILVISVLTVLRSGCFMLRLTFSFLLRAIIVLLFGHEFLPKKLFRANPAYSLSQKVVFTKAIVASKSNWAVFLLLAVYCVNFTADDDDDRRKIEPNHHHYNAPQASICRGIISEITDIK